MTAISTVLKHIQNGPRLAEPQFHLLRFFSIYYFCFSLSASEFEILRKLNSHNAFVTWLRAMLKVSFPWNSLNLINGNYFSIIFEMKNSEESSA